MALVLMSGRELQRIEVLSRLAEGRLTTDAAATPRRPRRKSIGDGRPSGG